MIYLKIQGKCISKDNEKMFNKQGRPFLSSRFKAFAEIVKWQVKQQYKQEPIIGDIKVEVVFVMKNRVHADLTNLPKGIFDSLNKLVWKDDRQIKECKLSVIYGEKEETIIFVEEL